MLRKLLLMACVPFILVGCGTTILTRTPSPSAPDGYATYPEFRKPNAKKVVLVILENTNPDHARAEPFLKCLVDSGAYLGNYYAVAHPSQPNYIALVSGSTQGVDGDSPATLDRPFLGDEEHQLDWKVFAEQYKEERIGECNLSPKIDNTEYVRKHVPQLSFQYMQEDNAFCRAHVADTDAFFAAAKAYTLPAFSLVIPNLKNDAHGSNTDVLFRPHAELLSDADGWLRRNFSGLIRDPEFRRDVLLVVTFDENDTPWSRYGWDEDNKVFAVFFGDDVIPGRKEHALYTHYDLLRTIETIHDIKPMASGDRKARVIRGIWQQPPGNASLAKSCN
jgi:hypothetical protein